MKPVTYQFLLDALLTLTPDQLNMTATVVLADNETRDIVDMYIADEAPLFLDDDLTGRYDPRHPLLSGV